MLIRIKHNPTILALDYQHGRSYTHHTPINTRKDYLHQPSWSYASRITQPSWRWDINMRATQDGYITHRSKHEKIIMYQHIRIENEPTIWRWSYQHGKSYARWLHHTPINGKDCHASTFMIIRIKHKNHLGVGIRRWLHHTPINTRKDHHFHDHTEHEPTILALELQHGKSYARWLSHTDQHEKIIMINLLDHTHRAWTNHLGVGVINMEKATQDGYITHRSIHEKTVMHQPSWSYA